MILKKLWGLGLIALPSLLSTGCMVDIGKHGVSFGAGASATQCCGPPTLIAPGYMPGVNRHIGDHTEIIGNIVYHVYTEVVPQPDGSIRYIEQHEFVERLK